MGSSGNFLSRTHQQRPKTSSSSASSLDIEAIEKKNEERLRRLDELDRKRAERKGKGADSTFGAETWDRDLLLAFLKEVGSHED